MVEAVVEFDYEAVNGDELTLSKGDIITNIDMMDGGWWEGELCGKRGMFPDNFVKVSTAPATTKASAPSVPPASSSTPISSSLSSSMKSHSQAPTTNGDVAPSSASHDHSQDTKVQRREGGSKKRKMRAKVAFSYNPVNEDELELVVDEVVEVLDQPEEGWWEGVIKGKTGLFPSNFVTILDESEPSTESSKPEPHASSISSSSGGNTPAEKSESHPFTGGQKLGFGDIFKKGAPMLKPVSKDVNVGNKPAAHPFAVQRNSLRSKPPKSEKTTGEEKKDEEKPEKHQSTDKKGVCRVRVCHQYEPKNSDELQLKMGDIINVLDKDAGDSGWWKGELNGSVGVFPDNFVEEIPEEKPKNKSVPAPVPARPASVRRPLSGEHHASVIPPRPSRPGSMGESKAMSKAAVSKQASHDDVKSTSKEPAINGARPPPLGGKKVLPPPTAGRPQLFSKPAAATKAVAASKVHDTKEARKDETDSAKTETKEGTFDDIKVNTEKLTHPNKTRPKVNPNRRPPSTFGQPTSTPPTSSSSSPPTDMPPLAPRSKHKKAHFPSPLATIPDDSTTSSPSDPTSTSSSTTTTNTTTTKSSEDTPVKSFRETNASPLPNSRPPPPDHIPPRPHVDAHHHHHPPPPTKELPPVPAASGSSSSNEPPWKTELKNRNLKSNAAHSASPSSAAPGLQTQENGGSAPPARPKAAPVQSHPPTTATTTTTALVPSSGVPPSSSAAKADLPPRPVSSSSVPKATASSSAAGASPVSGGGDAALVQELKKEIKALHDTITTMSGDFKREMAGVKAEFKREVKKLMTEVDEEKKHRMMMQVELERIKKLVMEGD